MKILMASLAIDGHFNPLTGIGMRLQANGHDVRWYTGSRYESKLTQLGIPHFPFRRAVEHTPENLNQLYAERAVLKGPRAASFDADPRQRVEVPVDRQARHQNLHCPSSPASATS